jgi:hypothetical protein
MNKIISFNAHSLRNSEHFQFMTDFDNLIAKHRFDAVLADSAYSEFKIQLKAEDVAIRIEQGSIRSKTIEQLDKSRDKTWNAISTVTDGFLDSPFDDEVKSAQVVRRVMDQYGDNRRKPYNEETASLSSLVTDFTAPANAPHVEKLHLTAWVSALKAINEEFQGTFNERNAEYSERESGDVRAVRSLVDHSYEEITMKINASIILNMAKPEVEGFVNELNEKIRYFKTTLASRAGRKKDEEKE